MLFTFIIVHLNIKLNETKMTTANTTIAIVNETLDKAMFKIGASIYKYYEIAMMFEYRKLVFIQTTNNTFVCYIDDDCQIESNSLEEVLMFIESNM